jgi:hypothetical protein
MQCVGRGVGVLGKGWGRGWGEGGGHSEMRKQAAPHSPTPQNKIQTIIAITTALYTILKIDL